MDGLCLNTGIHGMAPKILAPGALEVRPSVIQVRAVGRSAAVSPPQKLSSSSRFSFRYPFKTLWPGGKNGGEDENAINDAVSAENSEEMSSQLGQNENWVMKILRVNSLWSENKEKNTDKAPEHEEENDDKNSCDVCRVGDGDEKRIEFDRDSFSKMLNRVSLADAKLYAQMSYLGNLAYSIPNIKPENLLKYRGLRFVTSSYKKRELAMEAGKSLASESQEAERKKNNEVQDKEHKGFGLRIGASAAYGIAASAAAYLYSQTKSMVPFQSSSDECEASNEGEGDYDLFDTHVASLMATTDSMTAVVAAKEEVKQAVADDLSSALSSPCEWFICDDDRSATRYVIIQGSESLASWQANLLFEPVQFEGLDVLVHRGIYEAAKGIYSQLLPEVRAHLKSRGRRATFRFAGHSLGGSLSLLINLMLLIRHQVPASTLLPVIGFGSPFIMCGGDGLLKKLGLPRNFVQTITIHRDIVPRVFSCDYPSRVAQLLKAVNRNFRSHPCLINQKQLYAPMGELLILQPDEKFSPQHHLLPSGNGLYSLSRPIPNAGDVEKQLQAAQTVFLNSPHPLEILSDRAAYGVGGTIQRDHDVKAYLSCVRYVIRQELKREKRRKLWWSVILTYNAFAGIILGSAVVFIYRSKAQVFFSGILRAGGETITKFSRHVASQYRHWIVVLLFPVQFLLSRVYSMISFPLGR